MNLDGAAFRLQWRTKEVVEAGDLLGLPPTDHALLLYNNVRFRLCDLSSIVDETAFLQRFDEFQQQPLSTAQTHRLWFVEYLMVLAFGKAFTSSPRQTNTTPPGADFAVRALALLPNVAFMQDERPALLAIEVLSLIALYFQSIDMRSPAYQFVCTTAHLDHWKVTADGIYQGWTSTSPCAARWIAPRCF